MSAIFYVESIPRRIHTKQTWKTGRKWFAGVSSKRCFETAQMYPPGFAVDIALDAFVRTMTPRKHFVLLLQGTFAWLAFWLVGLPFYYQQYSTVALAVASILLSTAISLGAILALRGGPDETLNRPRAIHLGPATACQASAVFAERIFLGC